MIEGYTPLFQTFLATMFTWGVTAAGSAMVFCFSGYKRSFLDASLGFAAGIMTAATFWSLLLPALEISEQMYAESKMLSLVPVLVGFLLGAGFVHLTDVLLPDKQFEETLTELEISTQSDLAIDEEVGGNAFATSGAVERSLTSDEDANGANISNNQVRQRQRIATHQPTQHQLNNVIDLNNGKYRSGSSSSTGSNSMLNSKFRKIVLLIIAVTVHNIPEGLAVGVGFGAVGKTKSATFQNARNLAIGIGIQNFPEGLAVSLPLYASGFSYGKAFWYGQLSGMVEPIAGMLGTLAIGVAQSFLPYALAFAAGAMLYVVFENIMPEATSHGNTKLSTWSCMIGFCVMMCLDVGLN